MDVIVKAFAKINRSDFVLDSEIDQANHDIPLPIGYGQTISQPSTIKLMLEWLGVELGDKVLDVGSGSGWTSALLSMITGPRGKIFAVEKIPELRVFGKNNCSKYALSNIKFYLATNKLGLDKFAPYNRILVNAAANTLPKTLLDQLKTSGKLVIPVNNDILEITKLASGGYTTSIHHGFIFVPLV